MTMVGQAGQVDQVKTDYVILKSGKDLDIQIQGNETLADKKFSPASTFKVIISWAALESGVATPMTKIRVKDRHVPGTPREIDLKQAMFFSSNDYFVILAQKIGKKQLTEYVKKSGIIEEKEVSSNWLGKEWRPVIKGGKLKVTAKENHRFLQKVAFGKLASSEKISQQLQEVMEWPSSREDKMVYGKTGVWGGAVWFNGFGKQKEENLRVVTVLINGRLKERPRAIALFYREWGMKWDDKWVEKMQ